MRVLLSVQSVHKLFSFLHKRGFSHSLLGSELHVSSRTIRDWKNRVTKTIPFRLYRILVKKSGLEPEKLSIKILNDYWYIPRASKMGGTARTKDKENFGTPEGRRRGGKKAIKILQTINTPFKTLKKIVIPPRSTALAELMGIFIGDGHLSIYQASIATCLETDSQHAAFAQRLINTLFNVMPKKTERTRDNTVIIVASSKTLVEFLHNCGMPKGNKIKKQLYVPEWIWHNTNYQKSFLRGLFDTDGCVYLDRHTINGKRYFHAGWTITSYADTLIADIQKILTNLDFSPTHRDTQKSIFLRKQKEIQRYFEEIGTHNQKHSNRYKTIRGRVPKRP